MSDILAFAIVSIFAVVIATLVGVLAYAAREHRPPQRARRRAKSHAHGEVTYFGDFGDFGGSSGSADCGDGGGGGCGDGGGGGGGD